MNRFRQLIMLFLLLACFFGAGYFVLRQRFDAGRGMPEYSVYSDDYNGLKTAARVLHQMGFQPVALSRPIQNTRFRGLLIMVEPQKFDLLTGMSPGLSESDGEGLLRWVGAGNTLVLCNSNETPLHDKIGVRLNRAPDEPLVQSADALEVGGYTEPVAGETMPVRSIGLENRASMRGSKGFAMWTIDGKAAAWLVTHGEGRVIFIADSSLWTHRGLLRGDNVLFLFNIAVMDAVDGQVFFDEYHHGIRSGGGLGEYLRYHRLQWIALQVLIVIALGAWAVAVRLGPAVPKPPPPRADAVDYASAAARIYERAGVLKQTARHIARDFFTALTRQLQLRRTAATEEIKNTWQQRHGRQSAKELAPLLAAARDMRDEKSVRRFSKRELLHWMREFDLFLQQTR